MKRSLTLFAGLLFFAVSSACGADSSMPTPAEAEAALKEVYSKDMDEKLRAALKVHKVHGCVPAFERPASDFMCLLDWHSPFHGGKDFKEHPFPFRRKGGRWSVIQELDGLHAPACPPLTEAQRLFRAFKNNDSLKVIEEIDDGEGMFTDTRGLTGDKKGPQRIMCRYEIESQIGDRLAISYFWYENGKYRLDEVEDWFD